MRKKTRNTHRPHDGPETALGSFLVAHSRVSLKHTHTHARTREKGEKAQEKERERERDRKQRGKSCRTKKSHRLNTKRRQQRGVHRGSRHCSSHGRPSIFFLFFSFVCVCVCVCVITTTTTTTPYPRRARFFFNAASFESGETLECLFVCLCVCVCVCVCVAFLRQLAGELERRARGGGSDDRRKVDSSTPH